MIERRRNLTGEEFRSRYVQTRTPVIIEGMMANWPAMKLWTKDYLNGICGDRMVEVMSDRESDPNFEVRCDSHRSQMLFADFADIAFSATPSNNTYMVANNQFMNTPAGVRLMEDVPDLPEYLNRAEAPGRVFFWFGPGGTVTPLHHDVLDIILAQVRGSKRIVLFTPDQRPHLYNSVGVFSDVDVDRPDFSRFPLYRHAVPEEVILQAGEMIFLPDGHWHQVRSLETSISVSFVNFWR